MQTGGPCEDGGSQLNSAASGRTPRWGPSEQQDSPQSTVSPGTQVTMAPGAAPEAQSFRAKRLAGHRLRAEAPGKGCELGPKTRGGRAPARAAEGTPTPHPSLLAPGGAPAAPLQADERTNKRHC